MAIESDSDKRRDHGKRKWLNLGPKEAYELIVSEEGNPNFKIIDVRTNEERQEERFPDSIHINYYSPKFSREISKLDRDKKYLIHCSVGERSGMASYLMMQLGFREVYNLTGNIEQMRLMGIETLSGSEKKKS